MTIASRIRKIREIRGKKQTSVAELMNISQQAYSCLEKKASNARLETLKKYCDVMNVELAYLVALDVPVTEETLGRFGGRTYNEFLSSYKKLEHKLSIFDNLLRGKSNEMSGILREMEVVRSVRRA